jgi:putative methylase
MKRKTLEISLQRLGRFERPKAGLEQYMTPANIAADILMFAHSMGDVEGRTVAELGAGTGIFSVGACLLGAGKVYAVELDSDAISVLERNLKQVGCSSVEILNMDVSRFDNSVDTIFQNVPFGAQKRHADIPFLITAIKTGRVIYTLHNAETEEFLRQKIAELGGKITHTSRMDFYIPRIYEFHRKDKVLRSFVFFRIESGGVNLK